MEKRTPEDVNARSRRASFHRPVVLTALLLAVALSPTASPQTDTDSNGANRPTTADKTDNSKEKNENEQYDGAYLDKKQSEIDRLIEQRNFGEAYETAYNVRKALDDHENDRLDERSSTLYNDVLSRIKQAYKDVRKKADRYRNAGQLYRAYKYIRKEAKNFKDTAPYHRRLRRYLRKLKPKVAEAYRKGKLDQRPDFFLGSDKESEDRTKTDREETEENTEEEDEKPTPTINASEPTMSNAPGSPKAFEGRVVRTTDNGVHFEVDFKGANSRQKMGYFLFELRGLKGREIVRIDLKNMGRWDNSKTIAPMFSYGVDQLEDQTTLMAKAPKNGKVEHVRTQHGQIVPRTKGLQKWHYFRNVTVNEDTQSLTIRKQFPKEMNHTYIAHRPPYTFEYHKKYMEKLKERARYGAEGLTVHEVGETEGGRPLHIVELANPTDPEAKQKPVVVYGSGEHPDEMDTYVSMKSSLEFLLSDHRHAKTLRRKATYIFVPAMDPDGLAKCMYENICYTFASEGSFSEQGQSQVAKNIAGWFRSWANEGRRLTAFILVHNVESGETKDHIFNFLMEPRNKRFEMDTSLWKHIANVMEKNSFQIDSSFSPTGYVSNRLGGFLRASFGTMQTFVELNSQAQDPSRKLTLHEVRNMGVLLVKSTVDFLYSSKGRPLLQSIRKKRNKRRILVDRYGFIEEKWMDDDRWDAVSIDSPMEMENWLWSFPSYERRYKKYKKTIESGGEWISEKGPRCRRYFEGIYDQDGVNMSNIPDFNR